MTKSSGSILAGECRTAGRGAGTGAGRGAGPGSRKRLVRIALLLLSCSGVVSYAAPEALLKLPTATRPQLSPSEQGSYTIATFLNGWTPAVVATPSHGDYVVGPGGAYATVQSAVNAAIEAGGTTRKYIEIQSGTYTGLVVVPSGVPLTIYGDSETGVVLQLNAHSVMTGPEFQVAVGHSEDFDSSAPAKVVSYYNDCGTRSALGTNCTATVISYAGNLQFKNLTIQNTYTDDDPRANGQNQAVAYLNNGGDQVILDTVRLIGHQDTLWLNGIGKRTYLRDCFVAGDVDFIFGDMIGVFDTCEIQYVTSRTRSGAITAPSHPAADQGFLFSGGSFTSTGASNSVYLGRQWPQNGGSTGQTIIREVNLGGHIRSTAPWKQWDSTHPIDYGAPGNWRLAEFGNTGPGAAP
jgi:pectinesterase